MKVSFQASKIIHTDHFRDISISKLLTYNVILTIEFKNLKLSKFGLQNCLYIYLDMDSTEF